MARTKTKRTAAKGSGGKKRATRAAATRKAPKTKRAAAAKKTVASKKTTARKASASKKAARAKVAPAKAARARVGPAKAARAKAVPAKAAPVKAAPAKAAPAKAAPAKAAPAKAGSPGEVGFIEEAVPPSGQLDLAGVTARPGEGGNEVLEIFRRYDRNNSGFIDREEFAGLLNALGADVSDVELEVGLSEVDANQSGRISWDEFKTWWLNR